MSTLLRETGAPSQFEFTLGARLATVAGVLVLEAILHTLLYQWSIPLIHGTGDATPFYLAHDLFKFAIAYAVFCLLLIAFQTREGMPLIGARGETWPVRFGLVGLHGICIVGLGGCSILLRLVSRGWEYDVLVIAWLAAGTGAVVALFSALAPLSAWRAELRRHRAVMLFAIAPAIATIIALNLSQVLWQRTAKVTFFFVAFLLKPMFPDLYEDIASNSLGHGDFVVTVADVCSGLEGMGLMLVFCVSWLWYFRREFYFPRALLIIPAALVLMFLLNSVRIAALVLIGTAGYPNVAIVGFHSQAGWIAFNAVAFGVALVAKNNSWLNRTAPKGVARIETTNATAVYLAPLLAILAAGMVAHALSGGFDFLYPLRFVAALAVLWAYRSSYRAMDWHCSWRGLALGVLIFAMWMVADHWIGTPHGMPESLAQSSPLTRDLWIVGRALAATLTVPLAEELAYRGYLMRAITARNDFDALPLRQVRWLPLGISSVVFGAMHGSMAVPGILAGVAYGFVAIRTNRLLEAVAAHATTNALIVVAVLGFDQWQLW